MKCIVLILGCISFAYGSNHKLILEFSQPVVLADLLSPWDLVSYRQMEGQTVYRVKINSDLDRQSLKNELQSLPGLYSIEDNQTASVAELEAAGLVDSRVIFILDEIESRVIFILDEAQQSFSPLYGQYHVTMTRTDLAWPHASGEGVLVAVLDTGVDYNHEFLADNMVPGYDFVDDDYDPQDERQNLDTNDNGLVDEGYGHGTHVAGIIKTIAPKVSILPVRVADSDGQSDLDHLVNGIAFAILYGADIINLSMSISEPSPLLKNWLAIAKYFGVVVVTSSGNHNSSEMEFPSTESEVITVTSIGPEKIKSPFSNYSRMVDVSAPGEVIYSCMPRGGYVARSGTSMAAPVVSGQAAILLELVPGAGVEFIRHRIKGKSLNIDDLNPDYRRKLGRGMADTWNSITVQNVKTSIEETLLTESLAFDEMFFDEE